MSEQFAPLPYRALALAGTDPGSIALVVHLYAQGHSTRWGWLRVTVRELADRTTATKHRVEYLLAALVAEGLAEREIVSHGSRKDGTRLRLFDPAGRRDTDGDTGGDTDETRGRSRGAGPRLVVRHGPDTPPDTTADTSTDLNDPYERTDPPLTPPGGGAAQRAGRVEWVAERALSDLEECARNNATHARHVAEMWRARSAAHVASVHLEVTEGRLWVHPPHGLRARDVADGLARAAVAWLARDRGPPLAADSDGLTHHPGAPP